MIEFVACIIGAYLLGAVPFSIIIGYAFAGVDIRKHGSGNAGATNVYRVAGLPAALIAGILDVVKGAIPVVVAVYLFPQVEWRHLFVGFAAVLGHIFPVFVGFKGGKGVNTLLGVFAVLLPYEVGLSLLVFAVVFAASRIISAASLSAGTAFSAIVLIEYFILGKNISVVVVSACLLVTALLFLTHRANLRRLLRGEEKQITH
jgi:glycerol-3-phosphate acyltransferase PlsY